MSEESSEHDKEVMEAIEEKARLKEEENIQADQQEEFIKR